MPYIKVFSSYIVFRCVPSDALRIAKKKIQAAALISDSTVCSKAFFVGISFAVTMPFLVKFWHHMKEQIFSFNLIPFGLNSIDQNSFLRAETDQENLSSDAHSYNIWSHFRYFYRFLKTFKLTSEAHFLMYFEIKGII